jgi:hypothetical protein
MSWALQLVLALAIFTAGGAAGIKYHAGVDAQRELAAQESTAKATQKKLERIDQAAVGHEADKAQIRTQIKTIYQEVERVVEKPVYRNTVCFDDDGLRLIRAALGPAAGASELAPAVP